MVLTFISKPPLTMKICMSVEKVSTHLMYKLSAIRTWPLLTLLQDGLGGPMMLAFSERVPVIRNLRQEEWIVLSSEIVDTHWSADRWHVSCNENCTKAQLQQKKHILWHGMDRPNFGACFLVFTASAVKSRCILNTSVPSLLPLRCCATFVSKRESPLQWKEKWCWLLSSLEILMDDSSYNKQEHLKEWLTTVRKIFVKCTLII